MSSRVLSGEGGVAAVPGEQGLGGTGTLVLSGRGAVLLCVLLRGQGAGTGPVISSGASEWHMRPEELPVFCGVCFHAPDPLLKVGGTHSTSRCSCPLSVGCGRDPCVLGPGQFIRGEG